MFSGNATTSAPGDTRDLVLGLKGELLGGNTFKATLTPWSHYRNRYWAPYVNGVYVGRNIKAHFRDDVTYVGVIPYTSSVGSIYLEDAGDWSSFDGDFNPSAYAEYLDALTAQELCISWTGQYSITAPRGDAQVAFAAILGAKRGGQCRARLRARDPRASHLFHIKRWVG